MSTSLLVLVIVHVAISLVGIAAGFVWMAGLVRRQESRFWTNMFLAFTVLTSVTGFMFPFVKVTPGIVLGALSMVVLALAIYARPFRRLAGSWNTSFIVSGLVAQYFNVFVLVVQSFQKIPVLQALAPTQSEPPFAITQLVVLLSFIAVGVLSLKRNPWTHPAIAWTPKSV
jgi:hypothetical protein